MRTSSKALLLGLLGLVLASPAHADKSALYLLLGADGKMLGNHDANNYFNLDGSLAPQLSPRLLGRLGLQVNPWLAIEASASVGPYRRHDVSYDNVLFGTTRQVKTTWNLNTASIMPAFTWVAPGMINVLGVRFGQANLYGHVDDSAFGFQGAYDQEAHTFDLGILARSSMIVLGHFSIGVELGYDWTVFKAIENKNGSGSYATPHSPERNISGLGHNGNQTELDFSGVHAGLVIGLWSSNPTAAAP